MLASQIPTKFNIPFANGAGASFINPIPQGSQIGITAGAASLTDGFPPVTFLPVGAGGTAPWGRDFNGILNQVSAWCRWVGAGSPCKFDATFAVAVGGYPQGALLASNTAGNAWLSLIDNNTTDPNATAGAPGWAALAFIVPIQNNSYISADDTGSADNYVAAPNPPPPAYAKYQKFQVKIANSNLTSTPNLNIVGAAGLLGAKTIVHPDGSQILKGEIAAGMIASFIYDGISLFQFQSSTTGIPLRVIEAVSSASGQTIPPLGAGNGQITCFTNVTRNTLVTSSWSGAALTIGSGEDGLWSLYAFAEMSVNTIPSHSNLAFTRTRSGVTEIYPSVQCTPTSTDFQGQAAASLVIDLQVGDVVTIVLNTANAAWTIFPLSNIPNFVAYRVQPVH